MHNKLIQFLKLTSSFVSLWVTYGAYAVGDESLGYVVCKGQQYVTFRSSTWPICDWCVRVSDHIHWIIRV
jgi:hypothetical protein